MQTIHPNTLPHIDRVNLVNLVNLVGYNRSLYPGYGTVSATTLHILCPKNYWKFDKGESPEINDSSGDPVETLVACMWKQLTMEKL
jgi:hypothetical protein